ncbi:SPFH domain-containing protein [Companilactobacillus jidongensis]|uniref:hypothetical protein n=1 Tax=Companilactobacillus jidongensis TaxID=2486006 RepID=UPI000F76FF70|nr:hypothetical protein [Companilactobacillus jidongensis]
MIYNTTDYAKRALNNAEQLGNDMEDFEHIVDPIISQMCQMLMQKIYKFRKSFDHEISEECINFLEESGIAVIKLSSDKSDNVEYLFSKEWD